MRSKLLVVFFVFTSVAQAEVLSEEDKLSLEAEELQVQKFFPQYRVNFDPKKEQDVVYKVFLRELEEKEKSNSPKLGK